MGLEGTIPQTLFDALTDLTIVDFTGNKLSGTLPTQVGKLRNVQMFVLGENSLSGTVPTEIRTIGSHALPDEEALSLDDFNNHYNEVIAYQSSRGLSHLDLSHNSFNGTLPTTIGDLVNLKAIDVSNNPNLGADGCCEGADETYKQFYEYETMIPTEIGQLSKLQMLKMDNSRFMRTIPSTIGKLRSLKFWRVYGSGSLNQVSGTLPSQMGELTNLREFVMPSNALSGTIPAELGTMEKLEIFRMDDNSLSGTIPDLFGGTPDLNYWDTFNNQLSGDLPSSIKLLGNLDYLYMQIQHTNAYLNHFCKQRIEEGANGRKHNWQVLANEWISYNDISACVNRFSISEAYDPLSAAAY